MKKILLTFPISILALLAWCAAAINQAVPAADLSRPSDSASATASLGWSKGDKNIAVDFKLTLIIESVKVTSTKEIDVLSSTETIAFPKFDLPLNSNKVIKLADYTLQVRHSGGKFDQIEILLNNSEGRWYAGVAKLERDSPMVVLLCSFGFKPGEQPILK